jgi:hypothetical protein
MTLPKCVAITYLRTFTLASLMDSNWVEGGMILGQNEECLLNGGRFVPHDFNLYKRHLNSYAGNYETT